MPHLQRKDSKVERKARKYTRVYLSRRALGQYSQRPWVGFPVQTDRPGRQIDKGEGKEEEEGKEDFQLTIFKGLLKKSKQENLAPEE